MTDLRAFSTPRQVLVLSPSRELAFQIARVAEAAVQGTGLHAVARAEALSALMDRTLLGSPPVLVLRSCVR